MKKLLDKTPLPKWWAEAKENYSPDEIVKFLINNKDKLEDAFKKIDDKKRLYKASNWMFSLFSRLAGVADKISEKIQRYLLRFSFFRGFIEKARGWKNQLNFKELVEFIRTKIYSLRRAPHNEKAIQMLEEIMEFASKRGLDINQHIPKAKEMLLEKKNQLLQHKFFQEFTKTRLEQLLAVPFSFDRCIHPVLPDSAFWHKFFEYLERKIVVDIILVDRNDFRVSFKHSDPATIQATEVIRILNRLSAIKNKGRRIFFIGHHEGYLGPYFVRSVLRKLGFDNLTGNCNTVVGPRMFSNVVLRNGAANVGNLFVAVPSQKTTAIKTSGLAEELQKTAAKTQCLIKLPDAGLYLIKKLNYHEFKTLMINRDTTEFEPHTSFFDTGKLDELMAYLEAGNFYETMQDLKEEDYCLFKNIMKECFIIFPEGSRSYTDPDGSVVLKYINPKYMQAYMRPGDYIAPVNLVGGSDITRGWRLSSATLGISLGDPYEITAEMMENYKIEGVNVMKTIADLPNIKKVRFKEEIQSKRSSNETV